MTRFMSRFMTRFTTRFTTRNGSTVLGIDAHPRAGVAICAALGLALVLAAPLATRAAEAAATPLVATRLDAANFAALSPGGADATGGIGDWALSNGVLCAVFADAAHESDVAPFGGGLIDLGHCGRADDQLVLLQPLANLTRSGAIPVDTAQAQVRGDAALLTTRGRWRGVEIETVWRLDRARPERLGIVTRAQRREVGERLFAIGDVALHTQHALRPFALDLDGGGLSDGFEHPDVDLASPLSIARATRAADVRLLLGARGLEPGIGYALRATGHVRERGDGSRDDLTALSLSSEPFTSFAVFAAPFWPVPWRDRVRGLGPLEMLQTLWMDLAVGETLVFEREILVSKRSDAASLTDPLFSDTHRVSGCGEDPGARLHIHDADGRIRTEAAADEDGCFALRLPAGDYRLDLLGVAGGETQRSFSVSRSHVALGRIAAPPRARVRLPRGEPMRLVFLGEDGAPDPRFGDERPPIRFGDDPKPASTLTRDVHLAGARTDPDAIVLAPGRYRVLAGRGLEYGLREAHLELEAGDDTMLAIAAPARVLETPGWISADLHVHAAPSDDSALPLWLRLSSFVAEGCEILVATDHDHLTDYAPLIRDLQLGGAVASVTGQEVTSNVRTPEAPDTFGHANVFPLPFEPLAYRKGALANEGRRLRSVIAAVRALGGERLVQLNHPRGGDDRSGAQAFFSHLSVAGRPFDPALPLSATPNDVLLERDPSTASPEQPDGYADLDFDAIELLNGSSLTRYRQVREDWFALLRHGLVRTATANSDSHILREIVGVPRTMVALAGEAAADPDATRAVDSPAGFDEAAFVRALRRGRAYGTTGPLLEFSVGGAGLGETVSAEEAEIRLAIQAAPWVDVAHARFYIDGELAYETEAAAGDVVSLRHRFVRDAFVTAEVEGTPGRDYAARLPGFTPFAFTNPVFVDADGDGRWSPPAPLAAASAPAPGTGSRAGR